MTDKLKYRIALTLIKGIGPVTARQLVSYLGDEEAIFKEKASNLQRIPGIGPATAADIVSANVMKRAEQEIEFINNGKITPLFFTDPDYPQRLLGCDDAPVIIYQKGQNVLNQPKILSIVGTRRVSEEGKENCEKLVEGIAKLFGNVVIVSGMAYGVDICAHREALKHKLPTVGIMAHGLDRIYPPPHRQTAVDMLDEGALVSEFISRTEPDKPNFVKRNRIIAGLADAVIVIESGVKGGALITAKLASSYNRDVLAYPGSIRNPMTEGCHWLIKRNIAGLIDRAEDIEEHLGWKTLTTNNKGIQTKLFVELNTPEEQAIYQTLLKEREIDINSLCQATKMPISKVSAILLQFEFSGMVKCLPGNNYRMI